MMEIRQFPSHCPVKRFHMTALPGWLDDPDYVAARKVIPEL